MRRELNIPIVTNDPVMAFSRPFQMGRGRNVLTVIVKATATLTLGGRAVFVAPEPPTGDVHVGDDLLSSVVYPSDMAIFKPRADVTVTGSAHAPKPGTRRMRVRFAFGGRRGFDRRLAVFGPRRWDRAVVRVAPGEPGPFDAVPILWENAFGGAELGDNPAGCGIAGDRLPALEDPDDLLASPDSRPRPMGFGPIPMLWPARWSRLGSYDRKWLDERYPFFPADFDWAFFQHAPPEQQLEKVASDAPFVLQGLHREHEVVEGRLPGVEPQAFLQRKGGDFVAQRLVLDTVHFDAEELRVHLVWRGVAEVADAEARDVASIFVVLGDPLELDAARAAFLALTGPFGTDPFGGTTAENRDREVAGVARALEGAGVADPGPSPPVTPAPVAKETRQAVEAMLASGTPFTGQELEGADLAGLDFSGRNLVGADLRRARLAAARFAGTDLRGARLAGADLTDADLSGAQLDAADLHGAVLEGANLRAVTLLGADLSRARAARATFDEAQGEQASFSEGDFTDGSFADSNLPSADFSRAKLDGARFDGAALPAIRLYEARGERVSFRGADISEARADEAHLVGCDLGEAKATGSVWEDAVLDGSSFKQARLDGASLCRASCLRASFVAAEMKEARLTGARLDQAQFLGANLMRAACDDASLERADLRGASLYAAELWQADLTGARLDNADLSATKRGER